MCGRYALASTTPEDLRARYPLGESVEIRRRWNVAPGDEVLAVALREGVATGGLLRWGFVPPWADDPAVGFKMINARAETVAEKPAYRDAFRRHRCLILADGFYEWQRDGTRQPFHIARADGAPFAFAGLHTAWRDPRGEWLRSATIVTTVANEAIGSIHPRMPVILERSDEQAWLDPEAPVERLQTLLRPLEASETASRPVSKAVNDARYDGPECLEDPVPEPVQDSLFGE